MNPKSHNDGDRMKSIDNHEENKSNNKSDISGNRHLSKKTNRKSELFLNIAADEEEDVLNLQLNLDEDPLT